MIQRKRLFLVACIAIAIAATFWGTSRYPSLGEKAAMGAGIVLEDPLGFEARIAAGPDDSVARRIFVTTVNWVSTNRKGMTFGVLFAASVLTLMGLLERRSFKGLFANTLLGIGLGAPLGVCVNCAAPIAKGMHQGGARLETTLAAMVSSPTLNVVVLTMLFSLFPLEFAASRLFLTLVTLLLVVPIVARVAAAREPATAGVPGAAVCAPPQAAQPKAPETWGFAVGWTLRNFARQLGYIVRVTVPLMLLAGILGAVAVTLLPWERLLALMPAGGLKLLVMLVPVAAFGLFLPVPIAFDVVVCAAFLAAGMPGAYVNTLLFSLGVFSVYPFLILWQGVSRVAAVALSGALMALSVAAGVGAYYYEKWDFERQERILLAGLAEARPRPAIPDLAATLSARDVEARVKARAGVWSPVTPAAGAGVLVESLPLAPAGSPSGRMRRLLGPEVGLIVENRTPAVYKFTAPYHSGWPIAAGDVNDDGWQDLVVGSDHGVHLFVNDGGSFVEQRLELPQFQDQIVGLVALADFDQDGRLDLFLSAYRKGTYVVYNRGGEWSGGDVVQLPTSTANMLNAASFGDVDKDGDLDVAAGHWSAGRWTRDSPEGSRSALLVNTGAAFSRQPLEGKPGETLSVLLSDIDLDGELDLLIGNDFPDAPDFVYLGRAGTGFERVKGDKPIPHLPETTMSFDTADVDNDLVPELYAAQISGSRPGQIDMLDTWTPVAACGEYEDRALRQTCAERVAVQVTAWEALRRRSVGPCLEIQGAADRHDCMAYVVMEAAIKRVRDPRYCDHIPDSREPLRFICRFAFTPPAETSHSERREWLAQVRNQNVLLQRAGDAWQDRSAAFGVEVGGWAWNSKFADLDADGWQDLYVANGAIHKENRESKLWYRNRAGRRFENRTREAGLVNHQPTGGSVYLDADNDGDLDLVTVTIDGPLVFHRNEMSENASLQVELRDHLGNRFGIGGKVVIELPDAQGKQFREIKAGGGYLSFDPYQAHFGLGTQPGAERIVVTWSTGEVSELRGPFPAGRRYRVTRVPHPPGSDRAGAPGS